MSEEMHLLLEEVIKSKIYVIRGKKVMIDRDLAELYNVETRVLNQAVRRNEKRFPKDFMFQMTKVEMENWISQIVISNSEKMGYRKPPLVFTEQGVAMLSSVLNSEQAILVNIQIIRVFTKMREILYLHKDILLKLEKLEKKDIEQDEKIILIFEYLKQLEKSKKKELDQENRPRIGYKQSE
ncbi:MAG: ORF6N domain-containing protein [Bacteroidales bacterium]|nr:ORF6N domain-containing protein [Bacteroidales bacterium]MCF8390837.1 ORF6N domain-containing protein [Bacteroidales bacterium]